MNWPALNGRVALHLQQAGWTKAFDRAPVLYIRWGTYHMRCGTPRISDSGCLIRFGRRMFSQPASDCRKLVTSRYFYRYMVAMSLRNRVYVPV